MTELAGRNESDINIATLARLWLRLSGIQEGTSLISTLQLWPDYDRYCRHLIDTAKVLHSGDSVFC